METQLRRLSKYREVLLIALVMLSTAIFSFAVLMPKSLRLDEAQSVWQTNHTLLGTITIIAEDVHVPLYFIGLRLWEMAFGSSVVMLRSFSLIFLLLSIPALYLLGKEIYGERTASFTILIAAVSPFLLWYGSEARMYTLLFLLAILNHLFFVRLWRNHRKRPLTWFLYGLTAALGAMTHYFFLLLLLVQALFYFTHKDLFEDGALKKFLIVAGIVTLEIGVWFAFRAHTGTSNANPALQTPTSVDLFNIFSNDFLGLQANPLNTFFLSLWPIIILLGFTFLARKRKALPETSYLFVASFLPILLAFVTSVLVQPLFVARYLIITIPSMYLLVAYLINLYHFRARSAAVAIILTLMFFCLGVEAFTNDIPANEDYRAATQYVADHAQADDLFVVTAPFTTYPVEYYYHGVAGLTTFPVWARYEDVKSIPNFSVSDLAKQTQEWQQSYQNLYVLMSYDQGYENQERLYLDEHYKRLDEITFSPNLTLYVYKLRYP